MSYYDFSPYVSVAERRRQAAREVEKLKKKGQTVSPVIIEGRAIARNFWGKAWCENLERYSDYENRLPRGRTYARNGSIVDLQIERGKVRAMVSGSRIYKVEIEIGTVPRACWEAICKDCLGSIGSLVELLQGRLSKNVMERVCREADGLFPSPSEIKMSCSCQDWADMCKHVAAVLYGTGARLDVAPDLLFTLRGVDRLELIANAGSGLPLTETPIATERRLAEEDVGALFGIEMAVRPSVQKTETTQNSTKSVSIASAPQVASVGVRPLKKSSAREPLPAKSERTKRRAANAPAKKTLSQIAQRGRKTKDTS